MHTPKDDMLLNESGLVPIAGTDLWPMFPRSDMRFRRAADLRKKADHLERMATCQTDRETAVACRNQARRYGVLAADLDPPGAHTTDLRPA